MDSYVEFHINILNGGGAVAIQKRSFWVILYGKAGALSGTVHLVGG